MSRFIKSLKISGTLALLAVGGCAVMRFLGLAPEEPRVFSHQRHAQEDVGLKCENCHKLDEAGARYQMPTLKRCLTCHEASPVEQKITASYGEPPRWSRFTALDFEGIEEIKFSHRTHIEGKVACGECHVGMETNTAITEDVRVSMDACTSCHTARGKSDKCAVCHKEVSREWVPASHKHNWDLEHGSVVKAAQVPPYRNRCSLCHEDAACTKCHQDEPPRSHNDFWRLQGHAAAVSVDRTSCITCHRTDFCDRCHKFTPPRSHIASWGSPQERHCLTCHFPLGARDQNCSLCHPATPGHRQARPKPAWHNPGMNCRQCHGPGLTEPLPHVDNGGDCNICHF